MDKCIFQAELVHKFSYFYCADAIVDHWFPVTMIDIDERNVIICYKSV